MKKPTDILAKISKQLEIWKEKPYPSSIWLNDNQIKVYIRHSQRLLEGKRVTCFEIGNVEVKKKLRCSGIFTEFLKQIHQLHPYEATFVESVLTPRFRAYFRRNNWKEITFDLDDENPSNFYLLKS